MRSIDFDDFFLRVTLPILVVTLTIFLPVFSVGLLVSFIRGLFFTAAECVS